MVEVPFIETRIQILPLLPVRAGYVASDTSTTVRYGTPAILRHAHSTLGHDETAQRGLLPQREH